MTDQREEAEEIAHLIVEMARDHAADDSVSSEEYATKLILAWQAAQPVVVSAEQVSAAYQTTNDLRGSYLCRSWITQFLAALDVTEERR